MQQSCDDYLWAVGTALRSIYFMHKLNSQIHDSQLTIGFHVVDLFLSEMARVIFTTKMKLIFGPVRNFRVKTLSRFSLLPSYCWDTISNSYSHEEIKLPHMIDLIITSNIQLIQTHMKDTRQSSTKPPNLNQYTNISMLYDNTPP